jgi:dTDP-glucose pyrophosphorylase/CBS domain-containing protein
MVNETLDWKKSTISEHCSIQDAMENIGSCSLGITLVLNKEGKLLGVVTDGDIRRGLLKKLTLDSAVSSIMEKNPVTVNCGDDDTFTLSILEKNQVEHVPVLDNNNVVVGIKTLKSLLSKPKFDNWVVLMAGGLGTRLRPLTNDCPKPLLQVGKKPILQNIIELFIKGGFSKFYISVNYKAEMLKDFFGNGEKWGIEIRYINEDKPLGTAGALGLLKEKSDLPMIVMNGDLLTKVDFKNLLEFHRSNNSQATICVREYDMKIPYGVVEATGHKFEGVVEKPTHKFFVNAGIYVLSPNMVEKIKPNEYKDMPSLIQEGKDSGDSISVFPIYEYWLDIGRFDDFNRAQLEVGELFD